MIPTYVDSLRRFLERKEAEHEQQRTVLAHRLHQAAGRLAQQFPSITRVVVVGSFLTPPLFRVESDVDIVVGGLPRENYFDALFLLEGELQIPVDLIREEEMPRGLCSRVENGLVLHARQRVRNDPNA